MNPRAKIVITDFINDDLLPERRLLEDVGDVVAFDANDESSLHGKIDDADAVMLYHNLTLSAKTVSRLKKCKLIVRCGVGYDNVDRKLAREMGIAVANVPDYGTEEVADSAIALAVSLVRGTHFLNSRLQREQGPWMYTQIAPLHRLRGRVFGIIGLGRIGIATALRAKALAFDVVFFDPYVSDGYDKAIGVRRVNSLEDLLQHSDVVSVHTPLMDATRHIINHESIKQMKRGSYLVNTARGGCVEPSCVADALKSGLLAGAGIDVLVPEPPQADHPLIKAWRDPQHPAYHRLIVNPHAAFYSEEGLMDMRVKGAEACRNAILGKPLRNVVN